VKVSRTAANRVAVIMPRDWNLGREITSKFSHNYYLIELVAVAGSW